MKINDLIFNYKNAIFLTMAFVFYCLFMPSTVQMLDTGELITNAYLLKVIHPPGYPLYTWCYYLFTHISFIENPFLLGSLLTIIFSIICLYFINLTFLNHLNFIQRILVLSMVAVSSIYWRYSLLPDVFMLHLVFISIICSLYLSSNGPLIVDKKNLILFVWIISIAHHHTTIFITPLVLDSFINNKNKSKYYYLLIGLLITVSLYLSLLFFNKSGMTSWGNINNLNNLLRHFLRSDYGTFNLAVAGKNISIYNSFINGIIFYFKNSINSMFPLYFIIIFSTIFDYTSIFKNKKNLVLLSSYFFYLCTFFSLSNIPIVGQGEEVLSRFTLMPNLIIIFLALNIFSKSNLLKQKKYLILIYLLLIISISKNFIENRQINNFRQNTVMEDWAHNKLNIADNSDQETVILETSDSKLFSLYYVQNILRYNYYIPVISNRLMFHKWYYRKVKLRLRGIKLDEEKFIIKREYDYYKDFILQNINNFSFFISDLGAIHSELTSQFTSEGTILHKKTKKNFFTDNPLIRNHAPIISSFQNMLFIEEKKILAKPCEFYFQFAKHKIKQNNSDQAIKLLKTGMQYVPYCYKTASQLCKLRIDSTSNCQLAKQLLLFKNFY